MASRAHWGAAGAAAADGGPAAATPRTWIGAPAPGGLILPAATPAADQLCAPRGVWLDAERLIVADTGNHRVLIWNEPSIGDHRPADVVLGQADFEHEGAQAAGTGPERGLRMPTCLLVHEGRLVVADAWNLRLLVWDGVPDHDDSADVVLGQPDASSVDENRGGPCGPLGFYWPYGIAMVEGRLYVADSGNRRVLAWDGIPDPDTAPELVLGQADVTGRDENRGEVGPSSFRWPHDIAGTADRLFVADAGNHRVLGWSPPPHADADADLVLGQPDFVSVAEFPYQPQSPTSLRFPYAVAIGAGARRTAVSDTANNRVLLWNGVPGVSRAPADHVLGQPDFTLSGDNRWDLVGTDTLCAPYGLCFHDDLLAIADSGNNRVMIWELDR